MIKQTFRRSSLTLCAGLLLATLSSCSQSRHAGADATNGADTANGAKAAAAATPRPTPRPTPSGARLPIAPWAKGRLVFNVPPPGRQKVFALTFDDGPWPKYTRQILQILKENNVHATFFEVGQEVSRRPEVSRAVRDGGHAIGNHSWDHPIRARDPIGEITRTDAAIEKAIGYRPTMFRPPYGIKKSGMVTQARKEGDPIMLWSADCADWKKPGAAHIAMMILGQARPGGISLMHDGGGDRSQSVAALPIIIKGLKARGYTFVTIPQLIAMRTTPPPPPVKNKGKSTGQAGGKAQGQVNGTAIMAAKTIHKKQ